ncbi:hypothetical protein D4764_17G0008560 [Takifugu flavidus]|uniref:Ig-like domain-containing protein n=1 Tax=Takifugu flavidus TaxID=433684 RepID=A0A5C6NVM9_9TELE|nr:hypothetical protein D4764_17G0008560 [Takifugu flavidus]
MSYREARSRYLMFGDLDTWEDQISRGNASLLLMCVKVEDQGRYMCYTSTDIDSSEKFIELKVEALIRNVNIKQVNDTITCSSERIYPEPELSWSTNPPSPMRDPPKPEVQLMEDGLYKISSTIDKNSTALSYSCTEGTYTCDLSNSEETYVTITALTVSESPESRICVVGQRCILPCTFLPGGDTLIRWMQMPDKNIIHSYYDNKDQLGSQITWRFNQAEIILNRTVGADDLVSDSWKHHVKNVSQSGDLTLQHVSSPQEGMYTCDLSNGEETYVTITALTISKSPGETVGGSKFNQLKFDRLKVTS